MTAPYDQGGRLQPGLALAENRTGEYEEVDHPAHYQQHPSGIECIDVIEHMTYNVGTAIKYAWRAGLKPGADMLTDLEKCRWHIDRELRRLRKQRGDDDL